MKQTEKVLKNCKHWTRYEKKSGKYKIIQVFNDKNRFLESPVYDKKNKLIYCVGSDDSLIYQINPHNKKMKTIYVSKGVIGCIDLLDSGCLISAEETGIYKINPNTGERFFLTKLKKDNKYNFAQNHCTYNDGKLDAKGRFVVGTSSPYNNNKLYSYDGKSKRVIEDNITTSNGIAWNNENTIMYYTDSATKKISKYKYNIETGDAFFEDYVIEITDGTPDGMCIDEHNNLWIALFDGKKVCKYSTENYQRMDEINFPVFPTSCTIGDGYLWVTTCKDNSPNSQKESGLYKVKL